ncbi:MAG TPA: branched-chain amino acid aminotransferase [Bacteroidales bacterium]|nr:branched-chain amino acid aminotransferase [Bacteroidales bacterium]
METLQMKQKDIESKLPQVDFDNLGFGNYVSDHMLVADYAQQGWSLGEVVPFSSFSIAPTALALHYGQTVFEGLKAFRQENGNVSIFRVGKHYQRFCRSLQRMCMLEVPKEIFVEGLKDLIRKDRAWVPDREGTSLYIRPFMFATEERFGVKVSDKYKFIIFTGPVGSYYSKPLRVKVEDHFMRASRGGTGFAKCGGNYGASFYPAQKAHDEGFDQILWTDGTDKLNIEESGTMNAMFVIDGKVVTPATSDTILDGVTRDSLLTLATDLGYQVETRKISAFELIEKHRANLLHEAFGVGTAAVTSPIACIHIQGKDYQLPSYNEHSFLVKAKALLHDIRTGRVADKYQWNTIV